MQQATPLPLSITFLFLTTLFACGQGTTTDEFTESAMKHSAVHAFASPANTEEIVLYSEHPYVPAKEFACMTADVLDHFKTKPANLPVPITVPTRQFTVGALKDALPGCSPQKTGIIVHHGLDNFRRYVPAFQFVCLSTTPVDNAYTYAPTSSYYLIHGTTLTEQTGADIADWQPAITYRNDIVVKRQSGGIHHPFASRTDVEYVVFQYEDVVLRLIDDNDMTNNSMLHVTPTSEPMEWTVDGAGTEYTFDHRMGICWVPDRTLTNIHDPLKKYKDKAADLGSPCPPLGCNGLVKFKTSGPPARPSCK